MRLNSDNVLCDIVFIRYFHLVVNEVLHKDTHKIGRKAVKVETYHECLWKLSHGDQASVSDIPDKTSPEQVKRSTGNVASSIKGAEAQETGQKVGMKKPQVGQRVQVQIQGEQGGKASVDEILMCFYSLVIYIDMQVLS